MFNDRDANTSRLPQTRSGVIHPATHGFLLAQERRRRRHLETFPKFLFTENDAGFLWLGGDPLRGTVFQDDAGSDPVTLAGQPIGLIRSEAGDRSFAQPVADDRPVLSSKPYAADFDGASDFLESTPFLYPSAGATLIIAVNAAAQQSRCVYGEGNSGTNTPFIAFQTGGVGNNDKLACVYQNDAATIILVRVTSRTVFDGTWHILSFVDDGGNLKVYIDGELDIDADYVRSPLTVDRSSFGALVRVGDVNQYDGQIALAGMGIDRPLSDEDRQSVEAFLSTYTQQL